MKVFIAVMSLFLLFACPLASQELPPEIEASLQKASEHYHAGNIANDEGKKLEAQKHYITAAIEYRKAFEHTQFALFAYNAARAYHQANNNPQAYAEYRRALSIEGEAKKLSPSYQANALRYVKELEEPEIVSERWDRKSWIGGSIAATGGALLLTSLYFSSSATKKLDALPGVESQADYDRQRLKIENAQSTGKILLISGGALFSVGAAVFIWDAMTVEKTERLPSFVITKDSAMLSWGGSF